MITIVDYKAGNIKSVQNMLNKIGVDSEITSDPDSITKAQKIIIPGVGHFGHGMSNLHSSGIVEVLKKRIVNDKVPVLGICLGAQLIGNGSEESDLPGLSLLDFEVVKFTVSNPAKYKVPHMGWSDVSFVKEHPLVKDLDETRFYFVHSFHFKMNNPGHKLGMTVYDYEFCAAYSHENIMGVQFHPEKSHKFGMSLLSNFSKL